MVVDRSHNNLVCRKVEGRRYRGGEKELQTRNQTAGVREEREGKESRVKVG